MWRFCNHILFNTFKLHWKSENGVLWWAKKSEIRLKSEVSHSCLKLNDWNFNLWDKKNNQMAHIPCIKLDYDFKTKWFTIMINDFIYWFMNLCDDTGLSVLHICIHKTFKDWSKPLQNLYVHNTMHSINKSIFCFVNALK